MQLLASFLLLALRHWIFPIYKYNTKKKKNLSAFVVFQLITAILKHFNFIYVLVECFPRMFYLAGKCEAKSLTESDREEIIKHIISPPLNRRKVPELFKIVFKGFKPS